MHFKKGDRVRCIDDKGLGDMGLKVFENYIVTNVLEIFGDNNSYLSLNNVPISYHSSRFVKSKKNKLHKLK